MDDAVLHSEKEQTGKGIGWNYLDHSRSAFRESEASILLVFDSKKRRFIEKNKTSSPLLLHDTATIYLPSRIAGLEMLVPKAYFASLQQARLDVRLMKNLPGWVLSW